MGSLVNERQALKTQKEQLVSLVLEHFQNAQISFDFGEVTVTSSYDIHIPYKNVPVTVPQQTMNINSKSVPIPPYKTVVQVENTVHSITVSTTIPLTISDMASPGVVLRKIYNQLKDEAIKRFMLCPIPYME